MTIKAYPVFGRLLHDGELYDPIAAPGITITLDEEAAADLPAGILGEGVEAKPRPPKEKPAAT